MYLRPIYGNSRYIKHILYVHNLFNVNDRKLNVNTRK